MSSKNQRSLRWHRQRAYARMRIAHATMELEAGSCNETVTKMLEKNREKALAQLINLLNEKAS